MHERTPDPVEQLAKVLRDHPARLSDVQRARGAQDLVARLEREAETSSTPTMTVKNRRPILWATIGVLAAAAVLCAVVLRRERPAVSSANPTVFEPAWKGPPHGAPVAVPTDLALLRTVNAGHNDMGRIRLETRKGEEIRAWLADCGRVVLRGDSELLVEESAASAIALRLKRGTVLVSFDHSSELGLTVRTRDAVVRVTGTVFAVSASDGPTRVSVFRGSVEVSAGGLPVSVTAGKSWEIGARRLGAAEANVALALRELRAWDASISAAPSRPSRAIAPVGAEPSASAPQVAPPEITQQGAESVERPSPESSGAAQPNQAEPIYRAAEKALAHGDSPEAKRLLQKLVADYPRDPLVAPATYELGRLAFVAKDCQQARHQLQAVRDSAEVAARPFHDPAAFLLCRCEVDSGQRSLALACLERFRATFPDSPHNGSALALSATLHSEAKDCARATPLIDEYLHRFPAGAHARRLQELAKTCAQARLLAPAP
jgi:ferric-dicitrate binding protein FerR (iron transport regulator)/outer membrane protein assembly factor BamD (BamD/ComL family)